MTQEKLKPEIWVRAGSGVVDIKITGAKEFKECLLTISPDAAIDLAAGLSTCAMQARIPSPAKS